VVQRYWTPLGSTTIPTISVVWISELPDSEEVLGGPDALQDPLPLAESGVSGNDYRFFGFMQHALLQMLQ
jgi:hypothetical protein